MMCCSVESRCSGPHQRKRHLLSLEYHWPAPEAYGGGRDREGEGGKGREREGEGKGGGGRGIDIC